jgi:hypothetical protein
MIPPTYRIAIMYKLQSDFLGYGGFIQRALQKICQTRHFLPGEEEEGYDEYLYIDDGPTAYMEPKYRPATYIAMDMVMQPFWYLDPAVHYFERMQNFDRNFTTSTDSMKYCADNGMDAPMIGFACDPDYHKPHVVQRDRDWIAVWHNCGPRIAATEAAYKAFPSGQWLWAGNELYAEYISMGKCALNWLRGDIINMRTFEVMAIGTPLVQTRHRDMAYYGFHEGEHYLGFDEDDIDGMLNQIQWVLDNRDEANQMALRARSFVLAKHTYYHRVLEMYGD